VSALDATRGRTEPSAGREHLELIEPTLDLAEDYRAMAREYLAAGDAWEKRRARQALDDLPAYIRRLRDEARGRGLEGGQVPSSTYWLVRDGRTILARSNLRHRLTPHLLYEGGHIGYGTRPSERRKGYGRAVCAKTLQRARAMGLERVLITCDEDNAASARIIEACGGVLESRVVSRETGKEKRRYWVDLSADVDRPEGEER